MKNKYTKHKESNETRSTRSDERLRRLEGPADELDAICRERLPNGIIRNGCLVGHEAEIRQDALIMSLSGFLDGRPGYLAAKKRKDYDVMHVEMIRCISSALRICKKRLDKKLSISNARGLPLNELNGGIHQHLCNFGTSAWPLSARVSVVLRAADEAVLTGKISAMNAGILSLMLIDGLDAKEISGKLGISTNAVYQQLQRVKRELPKLIHHLEPFD